MELSNICLILYFNTYIYIWYTFVLNKMHSVYNIMSSMILVVGIIEISYSQNQSHLLDLRSCGKSCSSNNYSILSVYLSDINGNPMTNSLLTCTPGFEQTTYLLFLTNKAHPLFIKIRKIRHGNKPLFIIWITHTYVSDSVWNRYISGFNRMVVKTDLFYGSFGQFDFRCLTLNQKKWISCPIHHQNIQSFD